MFAILHDIDLTWSLFTFVSLGLSSAVAVGSIVSISRNS